MRKVIDVRMAYSGLGAPDLEGRSEAEVFVNVEADLAIADGDRLLLVVGAFPVVELAVALRKWKAVPESARGNFEFPSMSLEGRWRVRIVRSGAGWQVVDDGDLDDVDFEVVTGDVRTTAEIDAVIDGFAARLRADCVRQFGSWIEEYFV